jgi:hypothetical protein
MRNIWLSIGVPLAVLSLGIAASCGGSNGSKFGSNGGKTLILGDGAVLHFDDDGGGGDDGAGDDGGVLADGAPAPACTAPLCSVSMTDDCSGKGMPFTSISGVVYDPAGVLPLYNIYVYIPSTTVLDIDPGNPSCSQCEAPASGGPIIDTLTDVNGKFTLQATSDTLGVPSGSNIPLVIQTGKWRTQIVVPTVAACANTAIPDPATPAMKLRLPANSSEGDMPIIAFTSGCDPAECFLRHIGIADSEFVAPTAPLPTAWKAGATPVAGAGHVRFYTGQNEMAGGMGGMPGAGSAITGGMPAAYTYNWWTSSANLLQNDIIFNSCECKPYDRGATAYPAMDAFLNGGGRLFTTHYYYNWFAPPTGTADLQTVAAWDANLNTNPATETEQDTIDQTFPKGMAFAQWLQANAITTTPGTITLGDTRDNMMSILPANCEAAGTCLSTQWIYNMPEQHPRYISFNTPVGPPQAGNTWNGQCGRAVFSDVHLSGTSNNATFPAECMSAGLDPTGDHAVNEKALEFLFFDLSSCVQNEKNPPVKITGGTPPPK